MLSLILKSKPLSEILLSVADMVETYSVTKFDKPGKWSEPKKILSIDESSRTITASGKSGNEICNRRCPSTSKAR